MKSDNSRRLEQAGLIVADNSTSLGGVAAEDYALKTDTAPDSSKLGGVAASDYALKTDTAPDSSKLGGKAPEYYIQPRNLLDNSDFTNPVNQRGNSTYSGEYGVDRWRTWNSDTLNVNSGYITVNGRAFEYILPSVVKSTAHTLVAKKTDGSILLYTKNPKDNYTEADNGLGLGLDSNVVVSLPSGDYEWAALYEGSYTADTLPPYVPKGYAAELAECQRYAYLVSPYMAFSGYITSSSKNFVFPVPCSPMRDAGVKPTVASIPRMTIRTVNGYSSIAAQDSPRAPSSLTVQDYHPDSYQMDLCATFSSDIGTNNTPAAAQFRFGDSVLISLDL